MEFSECEFLVSAWTQLYSCEQFATDNSHMCENLGFYVNLHLPLYN